MNKQYDLLIVDDDPTVIVVLGAMLRSFGQVRFAKRGADALRLARQAIPDLVLLDLGLPDMSGLEVLAEMRRSPLLADVPVVVLSGSDHAPLVEAARREGAAACLHKPPEGPEITACVQTWLDDGLRGMALRRERGSGPAQAACNRRSFDMLLAMACSRVPLDGERLALLRLAPAEDQAPAPDGVEGLARALREVARRPSDRIGHLGEEGLALLLTDTDARGAACVARELLQQPCCVGRMAVGFVALEPLPPHLAVPSAPARVPSAAALMQAAEAALAAARLAGPGQARQVAWRADIGAGRPMPVKADSAPWTAAAPMPAPPREAG